MKKYCGKDCVPRSAGLCIFTYSAGFLFGVSFAPYVKMLSDRSGIHFFIVGCMVAFLFGSIAYLLD